MKRIIFREDKGDTKDAAGILLVSPSGKILLQKRSSTVSMPNTLGTIGGHLKTGEEPSEGARREFEEESGYGGPFYDLKRLCAQDMGGNKYFTYLAKSSREVAEFHPQKGHEDESDGFEWVSIEDVHQISNLHPGLREIFDSKDLISKIISFSKEPVHMKTLRNR